MSEILDDDAIDLLEKHHDTLETIVDSGGPFAPRARRLLDAYNEHREDA